MVSLLLKGLLPLQQISHWSERLVGVLLIAIGFWGIRKAMQIHAHEHEHNGERHLHLHIHSAKDSHQHKEAHNHSHTAFGIGTLHGLAGSSHFFGVLPAIAMPNTLDGMVYLIAFGTGTVAAMTLFSALVSTLASRMAQQSVNSYRNVMCCCSVMTLLVGGYWLFSKVN
jgi:sulfite exporter TauE/SafE